MESVLEADTATDAGRQPPWALLLALARPPRRVLVLGDVCAAGVALSRLAGSGPNRAATIGREPPDQIALPQPRAGSHEVDLLLVLPRGDGGVWRRLVAIVRCYRALASRDITLAPGGAAWVEIDVPALLLPPVLARLALRGLGPHELRVVWARGGVRDADLWLPVEDRRAAAHYLGSRFYAVGRRRRAARSLLELLHRTRLLSMALPGYVLVGVPR